MKKEDIIQLPPTPKALKPFGYNSSKYYVGPWGYMKLLTSTREILEKWGVTFPFNPAAFKHDKLYTKGGSIWWKFKVDFTFLQDMISIIYGGKIPQDLKKPLLVRALIFYVIVTISTPIYIKQGNWKSGTR